MTDDTSAWPEAWSIIYDVMDLDRSPHLGFYAGLAGPQTHSLLDLGCGTGSITLPIAAAMPAGSRVVGVDLSPKMIEIAKSRAPEHTWVLGDICAPPVKGRFDLIVICFHTLQLLLEDAQLDQAFGAIAGLLTPGGRFAFDIYQPNLAFLATVGPEPYVTRRFTDTTGRDIEVVELKGNYDSDSRILSGDWIMRDAATGDDLAVEPITQRVRQFFPVDIERALAKAGMHWVERYGELDRRPFDTQSKRQVYVCMLDAN